MWKPQNTATNCGCNVCQFVSGKSVAFAYVLGLISVKIVNARVLTAQNVKVQVRDPHLTCALLALLPCPHPEPSNLWSLEIVLIVLV